MTSGFTYIARVLFGFLEKEYAFDQISSSEERWGGEVRYACKKCNVGVRLVYDFSNAFVFVFIHRLIDGNLHNNKLPITDDSTITCIDFNDTLDETLKMKPAFEYGENSAYYHESLGLRNFVQEFADRLRMYGTKLLRGDFTQLDEVEKIIKLRAKRLERDQ